MPSNLSAFPYIQERSEATPGLWNYPLSIISANIASINSTLDLGHFQQLSIGSTPPSYATTAAVTIEVNSNQSDYLYLVDSAAQRSSYIIGSRAGGLADGLNIWDASAGTMIASFSKQSIRFFQNVVGPVFDTGGALADTYNAATFIGSGSTLSAIQAAINQASVDAVSRVYIPASMYPYSASSISFIYTVQMVREGGRWDIYDVRAYGATGNGIVTDTAPLQSVISAAAGRGSILISSGTYSINTNLRLVSNTVMLGEGLPSVIISSYTTGPYMLQNANWGSASLNTNIELRNFVLDGNGAKVRQTTTGGRAGCISFRSVQDVLITGLTVRNSKEISIAHQNAQRIRILGNQVQDSEADGITGYFTCRDVVVEGNVVTRVGDDGIAQHADDTVTFGQPANIVITGNTIFGQSQYTAPATGRGIAITGVKDVLVTSNIIESTNGDGIRVTCSDSSAGLRPQRVTIVGNHLHSIGSSGQTTQSTDGISVQSVEHLVITGNHLSNTSGRGMFFRSVGFVEIVGNSINSCGRSFALGNLAIDFSTSSSSWAVISNNMIYGNASGGIGVRQGLNGIISGNVIVDNGVMGDGTANHGAGIYIDGNGGGTQNVLVIQGNYITDTKAVGSKLQTYGIRSAGGSTSSFEISGNYLSGNSGTGILIGTAGLYLHQYANAALESAGSEVGWFSPSAFTFGSAIRPGITFASEVSLGFFRSAASTINQSYGTTILSTSLQSYAKFGTDISTKIGTSGIVLGIGSTGAEPIEFVASVSGNGYGWRQKAFDLGNSNVDMVFEGRGNTTSFTTVLQLRSKNPQVCMPSGSSIAPGSTFTSDNSLGWYRSGAQTMAQSYGTLNLATNAVRFSMRTLAASSITASAAKTNMAVDEVVFTIGGASGASLIIYSGGTAYGFNSAFSAAVA